MYRFSRILRKLRGTYKRCRKSSSVSGVYEWLCDNYYLYEREGKWTRRELRMSGDFTPRDKGSRLSAICDEMVESKSELIDSSTVDKLKAEKLTVFEMDFLPVFYRKALLECVCDSLKEDTEENRQRIAYATKALKNAAQVNVHELAEKICPFEAFLEVDPTGVYSRMTPETKAVYRRKVALISNSVRESETEFAREISETAEKEQRHIGEFLELDRVGVRSGVVRGTVFIILELALALASCLMIYLATSHFYLALVAFLPVLAVSQKFLMKESMRGVPPDPILRMERDDKSVMETKVLVVISTLLPPPNKLDDMTDHLKDIYSSFGKSGNIKVCVLADLKAASVQEIPEDKECIEKFTQYIDELNEKYGGFVGAVRIRSYSKTQKTFTGRERKRGAIEALIHCLKDNDTHEFTAFCGDVDGIGDTDYLLVLDSDTGLPIDTVESLVSCAVHPINRDRYGVFVPVAELSLDTERTAFTRKFGGSGGISAYNGLCSELYQDLFGKSIFSGKGLININMMGEKLTGAFSDETVLSHDVLEGEILNAKLVSDTCVLEGFPQTPLSYFKRQDRWVRGDFQNAVFLFSRLQNGQRLSALSKYKLLDNLKRALTPVFQVLTLIFGGIYAANFEYRISLLISAATSALVLLSLDRPIDVIFLGKSATVNLKAAVKGLFRRFISHRNMLEWVTAANSERKSDKKLSANVAGFAFEILIGIGLCMLPGFIKIYGLVFMLSPFAATYLSRADKQTTEVGWTEFKRLVEYAGATWQYYVKYAGKADNWLPPDNVQESPVFRVAHRTSPTNIGFLLLCTLSACDFGFIDTDEMCDRLLDTLHTVERLEKYRGNLYNWYDTITLNILKPAYISTVDSGNFVCMLVALKEGLREYEVNNVRVTKLRERVEKIIDETDLSFLYDKSAKLFRIGYNVSDEEFSNSYYDLLMSEARMTGYYAIAKRIVPREHWGALSRIMSKSGRSFGPLSWTGTMFEYYLPHLLLPVSCGSMSEQALKYSLKCQKKRVRGMNIPFGMSESGFYAFDRQLNYLYKAHGVQKLGLKRDLDKECVISPYSTFLVLPYDHKTALENLAALEKLEITGKCGFYEAVDFTASRAGGQDYAVVRSFMAHHVGMSMLSLSNAAFNNVMQKRFMSDIDMTGAKHLLMEKIPKHISVFKDVADKTEPLKPAARLGSASKSVAVSGEVATSSRVYTNGDFTLVAFSNGMTESIYGGTHITTPVSCCRDEYAGVRIFVDTTDSSGKLGARHLEIPQKTVFKNTNAVFVSKNDKLSIIHTLGVHPRLNGEIHEVVVKNNGSENRDIKLHLWANPFLNGRKEGMAHTAFNKLFMTDEVFEEEVCAVVTRNSPDGESKSLVCGLLHEDEVSFCTSNLKFFRDAGGRSGVPDPCIDVEVSLHIRAGKSEKAVFFLGVSDSPNEALKMIGRARDEFEKDEGKITFSPELFPKDGLEKLICSDLLPALVCPATLDAEHSESIKCNTESREALWKFGISGDFPLVCQVVENEADITTAEVYMKVINALYLHGIAIDFVMCYDEGGNYEAPLRHLIEEKIRSAGSNAAEHIFAVSMDAYERSDLFAIKAAADKLVTKNFIPKKEEHLIKFSTVSKVPSKMSHEIFEGNYFYVKEAPALPFSLCLANRNFGTLVTENSIGFTWCFNSRENKLTSHTDICWQRDRGERLLVKYEDKFYDLLDGSSAVYSPNKAVYTSRIERLLFKITVFVPSRGMTKRIRVDIKNTSTKEEYFSLGYYSEPVLGESRRLSKFLTCMVHKNGISVTNENIKGIKGYAFFGIVGSDMDFYGCDAVRVLSGDFEDRSLMPCAENCVFIGKEIRLSPDEAKPVTFSLSFAKSREAAVFLGTDFECSTPEISEKLKVDTGNKNLDVMINVWLPYQVKAYRLFGRCGFSQCGGAYGFRDQLQDAMNISIIEPELAKQYIYRAASVQFPEGDILHWWHVLESRDGGIRGIRTRCSDDMLWLPLAISKIVKEQNDLSFLKTQTAFLKGEPLRADEKERYDRFYKSEERATLYEHGKRALLVALKYGENGLLKIGSCDWNDGYSEVGSGGKGESVWLSMFWTIAAKEYLPIAEKMGDTDFTKMLKKTGEELKKAIDDKGFGGDFYLRAFYDDGQPMDRIDSLPQSFATLCEMPDKERCDRALKSAVSSLYDDENGVVRLFYPPLTPNDKKAGYVNFYAPGTRENGGQYTHAAVWLALALHRAGYVDAAFDMLCTINPAEKYDSKKTSRKYLGEPYLLAGDVYTVGDYCGRAGWTGYTGAAGWFFRTVVEEILGLKLKDGKLTAAPSLPEEIPSFRASLNDGEKIQSVEV